MSAAIIVTVVVVVAAFVLALFLLRRSRSGAVEQGAKSPAVKAPPIAGGFADRVRKMLGAVPTEDRWVQLEDMLVRADVGPAASAEVVARVKARFQPGSDPAQLLTEEIAGVLGGDTQLNLPRGELAVVMVVGVNGTGKTTTIGKLAKLLAGQGKTVCLAACDTYRAAAGEQLEVWARRANADLVAQARGADPAAVAFDAVAAAKARKADVLIVDTAGRLHTKVPLMDELAKVKRVLDKAAGKVDEVLLVLDGSTGQNGIAQAEAFTGAVGLTGIALTKLDGTAKGGIVLAVRQEFGVPVKVVGTGEGVSDISLFDARVFAERLVGV
jgi:fused signal recognition particle receptor